MEFLLGADDEIKQIQMALQFARDRFARDEAAFAVAVASQAPQVRAIVDIERGSGAVLAGEPQRLQDRRFCAGMAEMRACRDDRARFGDEALVDVVFAQRHVGAIGAIKDQRKLRVVADAEQHQRGQAIRIRLDAAHVDAFFRQLLADEASHMLVADAGDQRRTKPEACGPRRYVGWRAADVFAERPHILQPSADLNAVQVD